jgi:hypothetical protein
MVVPRYRRDRQQPNNVARIWLLRGTAKHVCFQVMAAMSQRHFVPRLTFFWQQSFDFVAAPRSQVHAGTQSSPKRDEGKFRFRAQGTSLLRKLG